MAWTWMLGVCEPTGDHFTTGPTSATRTNIGEFEGKAVRRIWRGQDRPFTQPGGAKAHAEMLVANGKFVIPTLFDGAGGNEFASRTVGPSTTPGTLLHDCTLFAAAMEGVCPVVELVNEVWNTSHHAPGSTSRIHTVSLGNPSSGTFTLTVGGDTTTGIAYNASAATVQTALEALSTVAPGDVVVSGSNGGTYGVRWPAGPVALTGSGAGLTQVSTGTFAVNEFGGGKYWGFFRQASGIFAARGIDVILSGVPNRPSFLADAEAENIWSYATGGVGIHAYHPTPGSNLTTSGTGLYYLNSRRRQLDGSTGLDGTPALGAGANGLPIWLTEYGWVTKDPPPPGGPGSNLICSEATLASRITSFHDGMVTYAETLKVAATCLFTWPDWTTSQDDLAPFKYSGIRTNQIGRYQTGPNGGSTADWDYRIGVQVAQDADTLKPTLAGTLPGTLPGTASGLLQHAPGSTIRYAQGVPATLGGNLHYANDALYFADVIAAGKRPLACLAIGRSGTWAPMGWTLAERTAWIQRWVDVLYAAGVRDFEVGNEIENPVEPYMTDYLDLLEIASPIIRAKAGTTVILTSTLGPGADKNTWLEEVTTRGKWGLVDSAALHPYSNSAGTVISQITDARAAGRIPATKDIHITEIGIGSDNGGSGFTTTEAGQKTFLTSFFNSLSTAFVTTNRIRLACIFAYANYLTAGDTTGNWDNYAGLRRANGNYKPVWDAAIAAGYGKGIAVPWYYKNGGGQNGAPTPTTGRTATAKEALDAFGEGTVGTGSAPVSVTGVADQVTQTTARLKGTVDPNLLTTTWFYEYSTEPLP